MDNYSRYERRLENERHQQSSLGSFAAGIALGAMLGSVVTLLTAPQTGEQTRHELEQELSRASSHLRQNAESGLDDGRHRMEGTIRDLEREIKSLRERIDNR